MKISFPSKGAGPAPRLKYDGPKRQLGLGGYREGAGRPAGSTNKVQKHVRELCKTYTDDVVGMLFRINQRARSEQARVMAGQEILNRAWGKAPASIRVTGDEDNPIHVVHETMTAREAAEHYSATLGNKGFGGILEGELVEDAEIIDNDE